MDKATISDLLGVKPPAIRAKIPHAPDLPACNNMYGMEIEVEGCPFGREEYEASLKPVWGIHEDNSLRNTTKGIPHEFITVPLTYTQMVQAVKTFFEKTAFTDENFSDRCSIHVHANVTDFTPENLASLTIYYQTIEDIIFDFVGNNRDTNIYCVPWSQCRVSHNLAEGLLYDASHLHQKCRNWQKYTALNLNPVHRQGTVEFRQMHGTANTQKILNWLKIINRLVDTARTSQFDDAVKRLKELNTDTEYEKFFNQFFGGILDFHNGYRASLDAGVVNAKYSVFNFSKSSNKEKKPAPPSNGDFRDPWNNDLPDTYGTTLRAEIDRMRRATVRINNDAQTLAAIAQQAAARPATPRPRRPEVREQTVQVNTTGTWARVPTTYTAYYDEENITAVPGLINNNSL